MRRNSSTHAPRALIRVAFGFAATAVLSFPTGAGATIAERITTTSLTLPAVLEPSQNSYCTWGYCASGLGPRLYHAPLPNGKTLVGWSDASGSGHVSIVSGSGIERTVDFSSRVVRGLVGHDDGTFAVLLLDRRGAGNDDNMMVLSKRAANGGEIWSRDLPDTSPYTAVPNPLDGATYVVGDDRLAYGGGLYGAYFSVHSLPLPGHDGEQLTFVNDSGVIQTGGYGWGMSHSMAELIGYHPDLGRLTRIGVTDCYPNPGGIYADVGLGGGGGHLLYALDSDCAGDVSGQLGQMAAADASRWLVVFNAIIHGSFPGYGIGLAVFGANYVPTIYWLTYTAQTDERDPVLARVGTSLSSDTYLAGWRMQTSGDFKLAVITASGGILEGPEVVSPTVGWGNRDDSFRTRPDGRVSWVEGASGSTTLHLHVYTDPTTDVESPGEAHDNYEAASYPNPAREGGVHIRFVLPVDGRISLSIHDVSGRLMRDLFEGTRAEGRHDLVWDGKNEVGAPVSPGMYFYRLDTAGVRRTGKVLVTR